jgi:fido (protein-threonine AMPylation protein)
VRVLGQPAGHRGGVAVAHRAPQNGQREPIDLQVDDPGDVGLGDDALPTRDALRDAQRVRVIRADEDREGDAHRGDHQGGKQRPAEAVHPDDPIGQGVSQEQDGRVGCQDEQEAEDAETRITEADIRRIHDLVVRSVWAHFPPEGLVRGEEPGAYRLKDHDPLRPGLRPLLSSLIPAHVANWVASANDDIEQLSCHLIERLAELHAAFERIHPFPDGNGRVGRLVLSLLLVRHGYPPAVIHKTDRQRYLRSLERADQGDAGPLGELLARAVKEGIYKFLMPKLAGPLSVVPLAGLADDELSHYALVAAAQRGRLKAHKYGRTWYSTPQWVREYKASRYSRRRLRATAENRAGV